MNSGHAQYHNSYFLLFIVSVATAIIIIIGLLRPVDAQNPNYGSQGISGRYHGKLLALKRRIPPDAKNVNILYGIRIKRSFDCKKKSRR